MRAAGTNAAASISGLFRRKWASMTESLNIVTMEQLRRNTGERGTRIWIARNGTVYDVTDCPKWRTGLHEHLHFGGQDLSSELPTAPHGDEVFQHPGIVLVGRLVTQ
jgi:predicted heme/steroid binding protein